MYSEGLRPHYQLAEEAGGRGVAPAGLPTPAEELLRDLVSVADTEPHNREMASCGCPLGASQATAFLGEHVGGGTAVHMALAL